MSTDTSYEKRLYVAMDMGKNVHWLAAYEGPSLQVVQEPVKLRSHQAGLAQVRQWLDGWLGSGGYEQVVLGHEPSGIYHENWARALQQRYAEQPALDYRFLNPLLVKRQRDTRDSGRRRKTDALDLVAIAHCLRDGLGYPATLPTGAELCLASWTHQHRQLSRRQRHLALALLALLDRLWPGLLADVARFQQFHPGLEPPVPLVHSKPLTRQRVQALLHHCPNPHDFLALGPSGIQTFFRQQVGRCGPAAAAQAYRIVSTAVLPPPEVAALLAAQLQQQAQAYQALTEQLADLAAQVQQFVPHTTASVLTSIPGVSPLLAARYLGYLQHHRRFDQPQQVWAFAGFDPVLQESGDYRRRGRITRRGHPGLRDTLFLIGYHTAHHVPAIQQVYQQARQRGLGPVKATIHAARKANRLCHRLLYDQCLFDPQRSR